MEKDLLAQGQHMMRICNSCRYCEGFCGVWRAMEFRREFPVGDLNYLANLCHDCQECYYACQYAPPHEWEINPPLTFARLRTSAYAQYAWPSFLATAFRANGLVSALVTALACILFLFGIGVVRGFPALSAPVPGGNFYQLAAHGTLVAVFGVAALFSLIVLAVGFVRFCRDIGEKPSDLFGFAGLKLPLKETLRLEYLDNSGLNCSSPDDKGSPNRRWFHHLTFYGFLLCLASTAVAAIFDNIFHRPAPYGYASPPVILGVLGSLGLLSGPIGLLVLKMRRNRDLSERDQIGMDTAFLVLLALASLTGLLLLILRESSSMGTLLVVHLGIVMGIFLTLPYGKFVHGIYRFGAIAKYALERKRKKVLGV